MPSGGYRPGAGRPRKNPIDKKLEGKPAVSKTIPKADCQKDSIAKCHDRVFLHGDEGM